MLVPKVDISVKHLSLKHNTHSFSSIIMPTQTLQCMKFSAKTVMRTATFRDLSLANYQGTLASQSLAGYVNESFEFHSKTKTNAITYTFLVSMSLLCACSIYYLVGVIREAHRSRNAPALTENLVNDSGLA